MWISRRLAVTGAFLATLSANVSEAADVNVHKFDDQSTVAISIVGEIKVGDDQKFRDIAAQYPDAYVFLNSDGGSIVPAMEIGRTIRLRDYTTVVLSDEHCVSACALIWLSGTKRVVFEGGKLGFHASYYDEHGVKFETGVGNALVGHYLSQLGYGEKAVIFATSAPPDKLLWLNTETSQNSGISYDLQPAEHHDMAQDEIRKSKPDAGEVPPPPISNINITQNPSSQFFADTNNNIRSVDIFASELKRRGYQADIDRSGKNGPSIISGAGGHKIAISFSGCTGVNCKYIELLSYYNNDDVSKANKVKEKWVSEENFSGIYVSSDGKSVALYHYIIVGNDGITIENLIENTEYFAKDFDILGSMLK